MAAQTVSVLKFVGTISLGIATGLSTTLTSLSLPSLLALPTASHARTSLAYLMRSSSRLSSSLSYLSTSSLFLAYLLSPRRFRHPYLLYTSILGFVAGPGVDVLMGVLGGGARDGGVEGMESEGREGEEEVNGELVRRAVEKRQVRERVRAGVVGVAFGMQVVGMWGDGA